MTDLGKRGGQAGGRLHRQVGRLLGLALAGLGLLAAAGASAQPQALNAGAARVMLAPRSGDPSPPPARGRTDAMMKTAAQTNQWYSTLLFADPPEAIYALPLTARPTAAGLEVSLPVRQIVPTERRDVEVHHAHREPLLLAPTAFAVGPARLAQAGDWSIQMSQARGADEFRTTLAHGSPYAHVLVGRGDLKLTLPAAAERLPNGGDERVLALRVAGRGYALFAPSGTRWSQSGPAEWLAQLPAAGGSTVAVAGLPDEQPATLALLARHAYTVLLDTRVDWRYDMAASRVETTFSTSHRTLEGPEVGPLLGLYPHQWHGNASVAGRLGPAYSTLRGPIKLLAAGRFTTEARYSGFVPFWPAAPESARSGDLRDVIRTDLRNARRMMLEIGSGPYWQGKGLQRISKLMDVVEAQGDTEARAQLLKLMQGRIEQWFSGNDRKTYFQLDRTLGTLVAYPEEYSSIAQLNDHHFHYGYWIRTMAEIALRDPAWAAKDRWGGLVDLLVADIAHPKRGSADFPFLRNFDPYESHSWASGIGLGDRGNNQESSSEAVNAWAGLILWAEVTGDTALRDLGVYLYTSEIQGIEHYWFDLHGLVFPPEYKHVEVSMVFGGKMAHNTWWIDEPRQIKGINLLPVTTASAYMGRDGAFIQRSLATLPGDVATWLGRGKSYGELPKDIWQDIFAKYLALADPAKALATWDRWGSVELGDTRSHTLHWLLSLDVLGTPDFETTADTPLYAVFRKGGGPRTHLAFNAGKAPITVRFSDGQTLNVAPGQLARSR